MRSTGSYRNAGVFVNKVTLNFAIWFVLHTVKGRNV